MTYYAGMNMCVKHKDRHLRRISNTPRTMARILMEASKCVRPTAYGLIRARPAHIRATAATANITWGDGGMGRLFIDILKLYDIVNPHVFKPEYDWMDSSDYDWLILRKIIRKCIISLSVLPIASGFAASCNAPAHNFNYSALTPEDQPWNT